VDKALLDRLEKLERRVDIGDPRTASLEALEAHVAEHMGYVPTTKELAQFVAEQKAGKGPRNEGINREAP
jgi:hypothetical protein